MQYNIQYDEGVPPVAYHDILDKKICKVASKISVNVENVEWFIYDAEIKEKILNSLLTYSVSRYGYDYGFHLLGTKQIWISTKTIVQTANPLLLISPSLAPNVLGGKKDFFADVIMDEVAHVKTQKNHGDKEYDELLQRYHELYYNRLW